MNPSAPSETNLQASGLNCPSLNILDYPRPNANAGCDDSSHGGGVIVFLLIALPMGVVAWVSIIACLI